MVEMEAMPIGSHESQRCGLPRENAINLHFHLNYTQFSKIIYNGNGRNAEMQKKDKHDKDKQIDG